MFPLPSLVPSPTVTPAAAKLQQQSKPTQGSLCLCALVFSLLVSSHDGSAALSPTTSLLGAQSVDIYIYIYSREHLSDWFFPTLPVDFFLLCFLGYFCVRVCCCCFLYFFLSFFSFFLRLFLFGFDSVPLLHCTR
ncbi:hypothetical protein TRSC58_07398 [Trypanosoma rangeli SC58]|uniref:Uncharacterized protein n=1 Tax=Trypanosoma rangeli SC58 TaxID=429131 RepID=A0A061IVE7_TRYRA|nr:hypothetical protein TRSC58_07398 [Trypanosoma rangeli SC58]